ncbi:efflux RND transporter periplasmic adaptor subunit [Helicobacter sp.]|uniref:efflux RND transporter periplasmic adaptor subunit n=1 Tax=Helicobacter sp. TaxID=218 RepID=UPI002A91F772|nr:efflux RND transporter periplasmic adaptor subunit [Helicobacter sp.]MDY5557070.1 efflux RND transporter periplasmic adaptor subunit [Helicobacter sp.]
MKKFWKWIIGGILVCVLAIFGIKNITKKVEVQPINNNKQEQNMQNGTHQQNTQNMESQNTNKQEKLEQSKEKSVLVSVAPIQSGILNQNYQYIGSLYFSERGLLASEVAGVIDNVNVKEGQRVKKGELLATLNSDLLSNEILSKEGALKQARAQYEKIQKDFSRFKTLYESESVSFKEYEDALFDMQAQKGNMESISYALELLKTQKRKKSIIAPYDGVILQKLLSQGEWVNAGAGVFNIAKITPLEATFEVPFAILRALKVGDSLKVRIANQMYNAKISAKIPLGDTKARTFPVKLAIDDPKQELIEGLEVRASFDVKSDESVLLVPRDSILPTLEGNVIFIINGKSAKKVAIEVKGYKDLNAYIVPLDWNLSVKDKVIIAGVERLSDGDKIEIN